jgi:phosphohistidine phosphatase
MKKLIVIRHAKSSWDYPELSDSERPLNKRGMRDAPRMGARLMKTGWIPDLMISSPARRAMDTARMISRELNYPEERIRREEKLYFGGIRGMQDVIRKLDDGHDRIMIFSHNPTIEGFIDQMVGGFYEHVPTCAIAGIEFDVESWSAIGGNGKLLFFDYPKKNRS